MIPVPIKWQVYVVFFTMTQMPGYKTMPFQLFQLRNKENFPRVHSITRTAIDSP